MSKLLLLAEADLVTIKEVKRIALSLLVSCIYLLGLAMGDSSQVGWGDREVSNSYSGFCEVKYRSAMRPSQEPKTQWIPSTTSALTIGAANTAFNASINTDFLMPSGGGTFVAGVVLKSKSLNLLRRGVQAESQVVNVAAKTPAPAQFPQGSFSITELGWQGHPAGMPKSAGPFRLIEGAEYNAARSAANFANNQTRIQQGLRGQPVDVHEIQLMKFGGSATDSANKIILDRAIHRQRVTP